MKFSERLELATNKYEATFAACYNDAEGNERKAKRLLRRRLFADYRSGSETIVGLDPATIAIIFALIQLAFKVWKWAKDNGYMSSYQYHEAPAMAMMKAAYNAGEFSETVEAPLLLEMFGDDDDE